VAIANPPAEFVEVGGGVNSINNQEIIAAGGCLGERDHLLVLNAWRRGEVAQVFRLAETVHQFLVFIAGSVHTED